MKSNNGKIITIPNILSLFRICLIPLSAWLYCVRHNYVWTGNILLLSGATDIADGYIARRFHMVSDLGKVLDPIADKLTQAAMLICLFSRFPLMIAPFILMAFKEAFMGVTGIMVIRKTKDVFCANWHGKAATCLLYAMMLLHVYWYGIPVFVSCLSICASCFMIMVSFILYGSQNLRTLKSEEADV